MSRMALLWTHLSHPGFILRFLSRFRGPLLLGVSILIPLACDSAPSGVVEGEERVATLKLEATYPEPFGYLSGIRELPDGRLLAADPMSQLLLRLDLETGLADTLGGEGGGPQEFQGPDRVFPLPGGETLLVDLGNGRLSVLSQDGVFVRWIPMYRQSEEGTSRTLHPRFADEHGGLYGPSIQGTAAPPDDSTAIARFESEGMAETILAWSWHPDWRALRRGRKRPMLVPSDDWAVGLDGRIAIVRANGYSVDWILPDGRMVHGPVYEVQPFPLEEADKEAVVETMMSEAIVSRVLAGSDGSVTERQMSRGVTAGGGVDLGEFLWPDVLPVFRANGTLVSPQKEAWVERMMPHGRPPRMDVFNEEGVRRGYVELPMGGRVIGFGSGPDGATLMVFLVRTDEVGLRWLERHRVVSSLD